MITRMLGTLQHDLFHTVPGAALWLLLIAQGVWLMARGLDRERWNLARALIGLLLSLAVPWALLLASDWPGLGLSLFLAPAAGLTLMAGQIGTRLREGLPVLRGEGPEPDDDAFFFGGPLPGGASGRRGRREE
jgi:hypothetical protein